MATYFETIGRIDPLDLFGVPSFVPRPGRWRVRATMRFFDAAIDEIIATRRRRLERTPGDAPDDILTLLLNARYRAFDDGIRGAVKYPDLHRSRA
jgi:cytochrome P450